MFVITTTSDKTSVFYDVGKCKEIIIKMLLENKDICKLLLNKKEYNDEEVDNLIYKQVFPYLFADDTQTDELTYLSLEINTHEGSHTIKDMSIVLWVYCHKSIMQYSQKGYCGTRVDILLDMIERTLSDTYELGIGKIEYEYNQEIFPSNKYYGKSITFKIPDFKFDKSKG